MSSIFIPIILGILLNYDIKQKEIYKIYYKKLIHFAMTYYDILYQPKNRLSLYKKHEMISSLSRKLIVFLNDNISYASNELNEKLINIYFYEFENENNPNEIQDVYNMNMLIPIIIKEAIENYNVLNVEHFIRRKKYIRKKYHEVNGLVYLYVDSVLIDIARRKNYVLSISEVIQFYESLAKYRENNYQKYYKIYKFLRQNEKESINALIRKLKNKFGIKIKK